jgi:heptosyltransferase-2
MSVPALRELRRVLPAANVTLVSKPGTADIFLDADFIDEVLVDDRSGLASKWNQVREWQQRKFDLAVLFQNAFEAAAIAFLARVPIRIGYDTERRSALLTHSARLPSWKNERHESFYYLNIVAELDRLLRGTSSVGSAAPDFTLAVSESRKRNARQILHEHGTRISEPLVLLCPGSINSRAKRWPAERYAALADQLIKSGANVALIGSPAELDLSRLVCERAGHQPIVLTGKTTVADAIAIISIADVLITNDTGPAHIGAAVNTPTLVIFGPTNPLTTYPLSPNAEIIRHPPECAPCMLRDCPIDHRCMTAITVDEVCQRAGALISRRLKAELQTA